jgi:hypothetical protein
MAATILTIHTPKNVIPEVEKRILEIYKGNIWSEIIEKCPVDYGYLRQHWFTEDQEHQVRIFNNTRYAPWVSRGTGLFGPHHQVIKPTQEKVLVWRKVDGRKVQVWAQRKALAWKGAGGLMLRRSVKGMEPNPYVEDGITNGVRRSLSDLKVILGEEEL